MICIRDIRFCYAFIARHMKCIFLYFKRKACVRGQNWTAYLPAYWMRIEMCLKEFGTFVDGTFKRLKTDIQWCLELYDGACYMQSVIFSCCFNVRIWKYGLSHSIMAISIYRKQTLVIIIRLGYRKRLLFTTLDQTIFSVLITHIMGR